jgi:hypothetical protein
MNTVTIIKEKNGTPTIIEYLGQKYTLQHENQYKGGTKNKSVRKELR